MAGKARKSIRTGAKRSRRSCGCPKKTPAATDALLVFAFFAQKRLHGKTHAALFIGFDNLDADLLTFLEVVRNSIDAFVGNLADVKETVLAREELNDGAEVEEARNRAFVDLTGFLLPR